jgi:hypothetical protein
MSLANNLENTRLTIGNTTVSKAPEDVVVVDSVNKEPAWFSNN